MWGEKSGESWVAVGTRCSVNSGAGMGEIGDAYRCLLPWVWSLVSVDKSVVLNAYLTSWVLVESRGRWKSTLASMNVSTKQAR